MEIAWMSKDGIVNQRVCSSSNFFPPRDNPPGILENATTKDNERGSTAHFWMSFILITQNSGIRPKSDRLVFPAARSASAGCVTRGTTRNELIDSPSLLFYSSSSPRDTLYPAVFHAHAAAENSPPRVETRVFSASDPGNRQPFQQSGCYVRVAKLGQEWEWLWIQRGSSLVVVSVTLCLCATWAPA